MAPDSITCLVVASDTGVPGGQRSDPSPQQAITCLPSVMQIAEASVSGRMIRQAPSAAAGVMPWRVYVKILEAMLKVRSVALDVRSSGTTNTYEKKKHRSTRPAMDTTAGTGCGLSIRSHTSRISSSGTQRPSRTVMITWLDRITFVGFNRRDHRIGCGTLTTIAPSALNAKKGHRPKRRPYYLVAPSPTRGSLIG